jgi:hypothetical protein
MIWLTWRQHRQQVLAGAIGLALLASWLFLSHLGIARTFESAELSTCRPGVPNGCQALGETFLQHYHGYQFLIPLFLVVPLLVGLFWGAPLVAREIEQGTHNLAWTQSVTRRRWFSTKVALVAVASVAGAVAFAELVTWWSAMFVRVNDDRFTPGIFDIRGVVPIAYVLFALALGVLAGTLIRRTLPAMAVTLGAFIGVRTLVTLLVRPHYLRPRMASIAIFGKAGFVTGADARGSLSGAWILHSAIVDGAGRLVSNSDGLDFAQLAPRCPGLIPPPSVPPSPHAAAGIAACARKLSLHQVITYQPGSRFWAFQGIESAIYIALAAGLVAAALWIVRRRLA